MHPILTRTKNTIPFKQGSQNKISITCAIVPPSILPTLKLMWLYTKQRASIYPNQFLHPKSKSTTLVSTSQWNLNNINTKNHNSLATLQCINRWTTISPLTFTHTTSVYQSYTSSNKVIYLLWCLPMFASMQRTKGFSSLLALVHQMVFQGKDTPLEPLKSS